MLTVENKNGITIISGPQGCGKSEALREKFKHSEILSRILTGEDLEQMDDDFAGILFVDDVLPGHLMSINSLRNKGVEVVCAMQADLKQHN